MNPLHLTEDEAKALIKLKDNPQFKAIMAHYQRRYEAHRERLVTVTDVGDFRGIQGQASELKELLALIQRAEVYMGQQKQG